MKLLHRLAERYRDPAVRTIPAKEVIGHRVRTETANVRILVFLAGFAIAGVWLAVGHLAGSIFTPWTGLLWFSAPALATWLVFPGSIRYWWKWVLVILIIAGLVYDPYALFVIVAGAAIAEGFLDSFSRRKVVKK